MIVVVAAAVTHREEDPEVHGGWHAAQTTMTEVVVLRTRGVGGQEPVWLRTHRWAMRRAIHG